jgi:hypothetical protein
MSVPIFNGLRHRQRWPLVATLKRINAPEKRRRFHELSTWDDWLPGGQAAEIVCGKTTSATRFA